MTRPNCQVPSWELELSSNLNLKRLFLHLVTGSLQFYTLQTTQQRFSSEKKMFLVKIFMACIKTNHAIKNWTCKTNTTSNTNAWVKMDLRDASGPSVDPSTVGPSLIRNGLHGFKVKTRNETQWIIPYNPYKDQWAVLTNRSLGSSGGNLLSSVIRLVGPTTPPGG